MPSTTPPRDFDSTLVTDLAERETYGDYLRLDLLLAAQEPRSEPQHKDELLFIIQHQTSELWMKLMIHELQDVLTWIRRDNLGPSFKVFARIAAIQRQLFDQWAVLETLTPSEFGQFRGALGTASGFQSAQYRALEFLLGNKDARTLAVHEHTPETHAWLTGLLQQPSVYDEFLMYLDRRGAPVPAECTQRDFTQPYQAVPALVEVFRTIYENVDDHWDEYEMCEKLIDVEERFQLWRCRHMLTVQRIIGFKRGTGGSSGVGFLKQALDHAFFPELWDVRTVLRDAVVELGAHPDSTPSA
ncbi:MAG: tryptophan 2,3-dioxygenase [Thermoleophilia bacterium]|nr:tryptophan 2,3-dioxygenase [Thermoleophilia bacterium]